MAYATHCKSIIRTEFFKPLFEFFDTAKHRRNCPALDDSLWLESGVRRCLGFFQSGRDFLQQPADQHDTRVLISTFFDEFKNKLCETKARASSATAKTQQARLLCLTHNLMTLMKDQIRKRSGVINQTEFKRRAKTRTACAAAAPGSSRPENCPLHPTAERLTQRTVKFIRWLKNHLDLERDWAPAIARLTQVYAHL